MSAAVAAAAAAANISRYNSVNINSSNNHNLNHHVSMIPTPTTSLYESQKRRDWNTFSQYLRNHSPPLSLPCCTAAHVIEFLNYLHQSGNTKVHTQACPFFGHLHPPAPCLCPLQQASGSLDALIARLRAAFEENNRYTVANPFNARAVKMYLREVRDEQTKSRGLTLDL